MADAQDQLTALESLLARATPGPWREWLDYQHRGEALPGPMVAAVAPGHRVLSGTRGGTYPSADLALIATMRNELPALLAELRRLRGQVGDAASVIRGLMAQVRCSDACRAGREACGAMEEHAHAGQFLAALSPPAIPDSSATGAGEESK